MEIITSVKYDESRHRLVHFLKEEIKPFRIQLMDPRAVRRAIDNRDHRDTIEILIKHYWSIMLVGRSKVVSQMIPVLLADNLWVHVHLIVNGNKERMVLMVSGREDLPHWVHVAYVGSKQTFDNYMVSLAFNDMDLYNNLTHLDEE